MSPPTDQQFSDIDRHFADFVERFGGDARLMRLAAASLSRSIREGNICLPLTKPPPQRPEEGEEENNSLTWPTVKEWRSGFADSKAVGGPNVQTPLVIDAANRLYLRRYWNYHARSGKA